MIPRRVCVALTVLLTLMLLAQTFYWAPRLPERVASHFDMSNRADGWMGRSAFIALTAFLDLALGAMFLALPLWMERLPDAWINLPNKDHWLAPERRAASLQRASTGLLAIGSATLLFLMVLFQGIFQLNAGFAGGGETAQGAAALVLPLPFPVLLFSYLLAVALVVAWMVLGFRKPR